MSTERPSDSRRFAIGLSIVAATLAIAPFLVNLARTPAGYWYPGVQFNTDDHMVYVAWANQAAEGRLLMDNRFAVDAQPGLTVNLFFFAVGLLSKLLGIEWAFALVRAALAAAFVLLLHGLIRRVRTDASFVKLALVLSVFGGGLGFLVWHSFGETLTRPAPGLFRAALPGKLPIDVWQPEAYVFPSMLVNGLFVWALCLVVLVFRAILDARESWKPVPMGAVAAFLLMNTHSYDVLLVVMVLVAFLAASAAARQLTGAWVARGALIVSGALPAAIWFLYVLSSDPVFQARAATETFSPNFRQVLAGLAPPVVLASVGFAMMARVGEVGRRRGLAALGIGALLIFGWIAAAGHTGGSWMGWAGWGACFLAASSASALLCTSNPALNMAQSWAVVGLAAPYLPLLFQRKLAMGVAVPWAILAALGALALAGERKASERRAMFAFVVLLLCASSVLWLAREFEYANRNVARTVVHPVYYPQEVRWLLEKLRELPGRKVVLAMPGWPAPLASEAGPMPDAYGPPEMPDLNALAAGYGLAYAYAGHWSETPDYLDRRSLASRFFLAHTADSERRELIYLTGATHILAPLPEAFPQFSDGKSPLLADARPLGRVVKSGRAFALIEVGRNRISNGANRSR